MNNLNTNLRTLVIKTKHFFTQSLQHKYQLLLVSLVIVSLLVLRSTTQVFADTDVEPPTAPSNLHISMTSPNSVSLTWNAASDNVGVAYYNIYRNGLFAVQEDELTATFYNLPSGSHVFRVNAVDTSYNQGPGSNNVFYISLGITGPTPTLVPSGTAPSPSNTAPSPTSTLTPTPTNTPSPTPTNTPTPTITPSPTPTNTPTPTPTNTPTPTPTPTPDVTGPLVAITYPTHNSSVPRNSTITIQANASDASGVDRVEFYVNNSLICTEYSASYTCAWSIHPKKNASYSIRAEAYDSLGNMSFHSVQVVAR